MSDTRDIVEEDRRFQMSPGFTIRIGRVKNVEIAILDYERGITWQLTDVTSESGFSLNGMTFACENIRIEDGCVSYGGKWVELEQFCRDGCISWRTLNREAQRFVEEEARRSGNEVDSGCVSCRREEKKYAVLPCGHRCLCPRCAYRLRKRSVYEEIKCPLCNKKAESVARIYV